MEDQNHDVHLTEPEETAESLSSAFARFNRCGGSEAPDPLERLRFFCSLAVNGQDWMDVEPFFDAVRLRGALAERERCIQACEEERVDAEGSGSREDFAYNNAIGHCIEAIRNGETGA